MEFKYAEVETKTTEKGRIYQTPAGDFPSITTILGKTKDDSFLIEWRARVGQEEAQRITDYSASRGTKVHKHMEDYMNGITPDLSEATEDEIQMFNGLRLFRNQITKIYGQEVPLYSPTLKYAGRTDLVGEWEYIPAIIDYKTSRRPKKVEWIEDYFLQTFAYSLAHNELYGTNITKGVILIAVDNDMPQCFSMDFKEEDWVYDKLGERLHQFYTKFPGGIIK